MGKHKWGTNTKVEEAREREKQKKNQKKQEEQEQKDRIEWSENDKNVLAKIERKKEKEEKKIKEQENKEEKRKLYEAEQATLVGKNKQSQKVTQQDIEKFQEDDIRRAIAAKMGIDLEEEKQEKKQYLKEKKQKEKEGNDGNNDDEEESSSDSEFKYKIQENINHIMRDQQEIDQQRYNEVIDIHGLDDAFNKIVVGDKIAHPEKKVGQAFEMYVEKRMPELKKENPSLKRTQLLQILNKEFKTAPENPFNQNVLAYNEKK